MPSIQAELSSEKPLGAGGRHSGSPSMFCAWITGRTSGGVMPIARKAARNHVPGGLSLVRGAAQASGADTRVRASSFRFPSLSRKRLASRSTNVGGGASATKARASLVAMCRAVAGWRARSASTARPCSSPPSG
jgi:hypothetical protein